MNGFNELTAYNMKQWGKRIAFILESEHVSKDVKAALAEILVSAETESGICATGPELVAASYPIIHAHLQKLYSGGIHSSVIAIIDSVARGSQEVEEGLKQFNIPFRESEKPMGGLEELAGQISSILKNPLLPEKIYNVISDEINELNGYGTVSDEPENIFSNLKNLLERAERPA